MHSKRAALGAFLIALVVSALAPAARADDPAMARKEAAGDSFLENLSGRWDLTRRIRGREERNDVSAEWVLARRFLQVHMLDAARPPKYEALVLIGYDDGAGRYVAHWCDTYGARLTAIGYGKRSGNSVEFEFAFSDGPFYNTFTWHPESGGWTCLLENVGKDGKRIFFAEDTLRRP
jgi:hypothetical protein